MINFLLQLSTTNVDRSSTSCLSYSNKCLFPCFHLTQGSYGSTRLWSPRCAPQSCFCGEGRKTPWIPAVCREHSLQGSHTSGADDRLFPCLPFPVLLGYLGQHRAPVRLVCILLEVVFYSVGMKVSCVKMCQEGIWATWDSKPLQGLSHCMWGDDPLVSTFFQ